MNSLPFVIAEIDLKQQKINQERMEEIMNKIKLEVKPSRKKEDSINENDAENPKVEENEEEEDADEEKDGDFDLDEKIEL